MLEIVFGWVRIIFIETLPNTMWWCRCCLTIFFLGFLTPRLNYFLQFSSCGPWIDFSHSNYPHHALGRYRHTSSSRQFCNILCWLEILNYCPDGGNGNFHCSSSFLKVTIINYLLLHIRNILLAFSHCDGGLREFGLCFPSYLYLCEAGSNGWIISFS